MKLLIDAGNTRVKLGWLSSNGTREAVATAFAHADLEQALPAWLATHAVPPACALGVNVAGAGFASRIEQILREHAGCAIQWQTPVRNALGMRNGYRDPAQLGADRWAAMLGLWAHPRHRVQNETQPVQLLVSFGTATTIDTLSPDGGFEGGLIVPGLQLMFASLASGTANLPLAHGESAQFPTDTREAIASGVLGAQAGAILRQVLAARSRFAQTPLRLAVTGGAWPQVQAELDRLLKQAGIPLTPWIMDNPVLDGLAMLAVGQPATPSPDTRI